MHRERIGDCTRITWDDGTWWEVYNDLPYGVSRAVAVEAAKLGSVSLQDGEPAMAFSKDISVEKFVAAETRILEIRLLGCTRAWSFEGEVSVDRINAIRPDTKVREVVQVLNGLHRPVERSEELKNGLSSPSTSGAAGSQTVTQKSPESSGESTTTAGGSSPD